MSIRKTLALFSSLRDDIEALAAGGGSAAPTRSVTAVHSTDFTAELGAITVVDNTSNDIVITLPATTAADVGKDILFVFREAPGTQKITVQCPALDETINSQASAGSEVAKAVFNTSTNTYGIGRAVLVADNQWVVGGADQTYAALVYAMTSDNVTWNDEETNTVDASAVPSGFGSTAGSWWFAIKFDREVGDGSSYYQTLFATDASAIKFQGSSANLSIDTGGGQNYSYTTSGVTSMNGWCVFSNDQANDDLHVWINGTKCIDAGTNFNDWPAAPTALSISGNPTGASVTSGYSIFNLKSSCIMLGTGDISDLEGAEFTSGVFSHSDLSSGLEAKVSNCWTMDASGFVTSKGSETLSLRGGGSSDIYFSQI